MSIFENQTRPQVASRPFRRTTVSAFVALGLGALAGLTFSTQSAGQTPTETAWTTEEQVERGRNVFIIECGGCHGFDLVQVLAEAENADVVFSYISSTMPWENPGDLRPQQYADIIAFFLNDLGLAVGDTELPPDREIMAQIVPPGGQADAVAGEAAVGAAAAGDGDPPMAAGHFTAEQADQGARDFPIACGGCHGAELVDAFLTYETAAQFFQFITGAMPADDPGNLGMAQYLAITAYLMREAGFPAGDTELVNDRELLGQIIPAEAPGN